ncbi:hypothetical protein L2E82_23125 [Cichorium intybus]|uniref:Uncharacterized protein n=1 Tax=Cichorium intybus TaxID=13427 RepID=A0ACB9DZM7_CICIN|nr:hypothetical protein L2E82_23125 [Cichorium intybus]
MNRLPDSVPRSATTEPASQNHRPSRVHASDLLHRPTGASHRSGRVHTSDRRNRNKLSDLNRLLESKKIGVKKNKLNCHYSKTWLEEN